MPRGSGGDMTLAALLNDCDGYIVCENAPDFAVRKARL